MRRLLVASQKAGVGKTTSSINLAGAAARAGSRTLLLDADPLSTVSNTLQLAEFPNRVLLREAGLELPGVLCCGVIPGLDVLSPYEDGACTDADLDELISLFDSPQFQACYGCLVIDAPPFLGANPSQLLKTADEFLIVMRSESMAYRTLPAFLELVQRSRKGAKMRGILLTLPENDLPGDHCEQELRARLGTRILPHTVEHSDAVVRAVAKGLVVTQSSPMCQPALAYTAVATTLKLASEPTGYPAQAESGLLAAAQSRLTVLPLSPDSSAEFEDIESLRLADAAEPDVIAAIPLSPSKQVKKLSRGVRVAHADAGYEHNDATAAVPPPLPAATLKFPSSPGGPNGIQVPKGVWIGLGIVLGIGARLLPIPTHLLPILVGCAVALAMVLVLRKFLLPPEDGQGGPSPFVESAPILSVPPAVPPPEPKKNPNGRLSTIRRRLGVVCSQRHTESN